MPTADSLDEQRTTHTHGPLERAVVKWCYSQPRHVAFDEADINALCVIAQQADATRDVLLAALEALYARLSRPGKTLHRYGRGGFHLGISDCGGCIVRRELARILKLAREARDE